MPRLSDIRPAMTSETWSVTLMKSLMRMLVAAATGWAAAVGGAEMTVCVVDGAIQNNINYAGLATTKTKMLCEFDKPNYRPTLPELYADGWRLIEVVGGENAVARLGQNVKFPLYYLEREGGTAAEPRQEAPRGQSGADDRTRGFSLF